MELMSPPVMARAKHVRVSPYKVRAVTQLIQGKHIDEARRILAFSPRSAARDVSKVLESAAANAEHNFDIPQDELRVARAFADEGVTIPRIRPRAQGRAYRIRKRTSHITVILERMPEAFEEAEQPRRRRTRRQKTEGEAQEAGSAKAAAKDEAKDDDTENGDS